METWIVTGGAGFIGANFVHYVLNRNKIKIVVVDKLTYAGSLRNLDACANNPCFEFVHADIADGQVIEALVARVKPQAIVNFAAETHVDRSIDGPAAFVMTNVVGTFTLLEAARHYFQKLKKTDASRFRFLHISTDEVYGSLGPKGLFSETTAYAPNSPYSASKAGADHLVRAYNETYGLPTIITNCSNNYGPFQFPEKLIPLMILNALDGKPLPIYGDGGNVRDWLYVEDHCSGIELALTQGKVGEKYNIGGNNELTNIQVVDHICAILGEKTYKLKKYVKDRPGHDRRYAIDSKKIRSELKWMPQYDFKSGLKKTVQWYIDNRDWCQYVQAGNYDRQRLGVGK